MGCVLKGVEKLQLWLRFEPTLLMKNQKWVKKSYKGQDLTWIPLACKSYVVSFIKIQNIKKIAQKLEKFPLWIIVSSGYMYIKVCLYQVRFYHQFSLTK